MKKNQEINTNLIAYALEEKPIISEENCLKMWEAYPEEQEEINEILAELGF